MEKKTFEFWSTQPVPKIDEDITTNEPIEADIPVEKLRSMPYSLPAGFNWDTLNFDDPIVVTISYSTNKRKKMLPFLSPAFYARLFIN